MKFKANDFKTGEEETYLLKSQTLIFKFCERKNVILFEVHVTRPLCECVCELRIYLNVYVFYR